MTRTLAGLCAAALLGFVATLGAQAPAPAQAPPSAAGGSEVKVTGCLAKEGAGFVLNSAMVESPTPSQRVAAMRRRLAIWRYMIFQCGPKYHRANRCNPYFISRTYAWGRLSNRRTPSCIDWTSPVPRQKRGDEAGAICHALQLGRAGASAAGARRNSRRCGRTSNAGVPSVIRPECGKWPSTPD